MGMNYEYDDYFAPKQLPGGPPWMNPWVNPYGGQAADQQRADELARFMATQFAGMPGMGIPPLSPKPPTGNRERISKRDIDACLADFERQMREGK